MPIPKHIFVFVNPLTGEEEAFVPYIAKESKKRVPEPPRTKDEIIIDIVFQELLAGPKKRIEMLKRSGGRFSAQDLLEVLEVYQKDNIIVSFAFSDDDRKKWGLRGRPTTYYFIPKEARTIAPGAPEPPSYLEEAHLLKLEVLKKNLE